jgi:DUF4097 and DUF4098 domain-containing protein YvlB
MKIHEERNMKSVICLAALLAAAPAVAQTPIDETRTLAADGRVSIENLKGKVVVRTWDKAQVHVGGSLGVGVEKLEIDGSASALSIHVRNPEDEEGWFGRDGESGPTLLEITVPKSASVSVEAVSADIDAAGTGGAQLELESVSGDVLVRGAKARQVRVQSVSGDVDAEVESRDVGAGSVSGDVRLAGRIGGRVDLSGVSGDVELVSGVVDRLSVESVSGDAKLDTALAPGGRIDAESVSGNVELTLPASTSARLRVETFSGTIRSPVGKVETEEYGPGSHLDARFGAGEGDISLESFSGNVRITTK